MPATTPITALPHAGQPEAAPRPKWAVNLIVESYVDFSARRQAEIDECLERNLANPSIAAVGALGSAEALARRQHHPKL